MEEYIYAISHNYRNKINKIHNVRTLHDYIKHVILDRLEIDHRYTADYHQCDR